MASLDSDEVRSQLKTKMHCAEETGDHYSYTLYDDDGKTIPARTKISLGAKHALGDTLIHLMTRQLRFGTAKNFIAMVKCHKNREEMIAIVKSLSAK
jgi:hypothetical protein